MESESCYSFSENSDDRVHILSVARTVLHRGTHNTHSRRSWTRLATQLRGLPSARFGLTLSRISGEKILPSQVFPRELTFPERELTFQLTHSFFQHCCYSSTLCVFHSHRFSTRHRENLPTDPLVLRFLFSFLASSASAFTSTAFSFSGKFPTMLSRLSSSPDTSNC